MKSRTFLISNSSSSSFIVQTQEWDYKAHKPKYTLPKEKVEELRQYGFRPSRTSSPSDLRAEDLEEDKEALPALKDDEGDSYLGYGVACNQDNVITFLCKRGIPFIASCHYGHETILYQGGEDILIIQNPGNEVETYLREQPFEKIIAFAAKKTGASRYGWKEYIR
jgi:hypothetical protein